VGFWMIEELRRHGYESSCPFGAIVLRHNMKRYQCTVMKRLLAKALTSICSSLIYLLHNRNTFSFNRLELQSVQFSFSQFGEDLAICRLADQLGLANGVYVDAGAFHPIFGSNTLLLSKRGWRGINVDLSPERIPEFLRYRPNDYSIAACLSDRVRQVQIAHYEIPTTDRVIDLDDPEKLSLAGEKPIRFSSSTTTTLTSVIEKSPFNFEEISYLNIDCEGHDLNVLRGLDFNRCRPKMLSVEAFQDAHRQEMEHYLVGFGYRLEGRISPTAIFVGQ
jgi:FkbM family methyltransferase